MGELGCFVGLGVIGAKCAADLLRRLCGYRSACPGKAG